jgi:hypothetical protein
LRLLAQFREHLIEPRDLAFRFLEVIFEPLGQIAISRFIDQLRQRFNDLVLGVIDVLETVQQKVIHRFDVFGKQAHDALHLLRAYDAWGRDRRRPI